MIGGIKTTLSNWFKGGYEKQNGEKIMGNGEGCERIINHHGNEDDLLTQVSSDRERLHGSGVFNSTGQAAYVLSGIDGSEPLSIGLNANKSNTVFSGNSLTQSSDASCENLSMVSRDHILVPLPGQVRNEGGGSSYEINDLQRLRRYLILGSENNTYYTHAIVNELQNIKCLNRLLDESRFEEVLDMLEEYSTSGRVAKEEPILKVLALCASHSNIMVRKAAYGKVCKICNIPTKLFRFLELTQEKVNIDREANPPTPQYCIGQKRKDLAQNLKDMNIEGNSKVPQESDDLSSVPLKKLRKAKGKAEPSIFKKVNRIPRRSSGWGRLRRKAIGKFYTDEEKDPCRLLYLLTKYKHRHNWSHRQVLGYAHPKIKDGDCEAKNLVLKYITRGYSKIKKELDEKLGKAGINANLSRVIEYINVIHQVSQLSPDNDPDLQTLLNLLKKYGIRDEAEESTTLEFGKETVKENLEGLRSPLHIVREHLPTGFLSSKKVWEAMLQDMPMTALIRNLGKMSSMDLFLDQSNINIVVDALGNKIRLHRAKVHPMKILIAMQIYKKGKGDKGDLKWPVNNDVLKALDGAFHLSFKTPEIGGLFATRKRYMLCLDVSSSMLCQGCVGCTFITPAMASIAMAMVQWHIEESVEVMYFGESLISMTNILSKEMTINEAMEVTKNMNFGSADCSLPMKYARENDMNVDAFIVYTDCVTNAGFGEHPCEALENYNKDRNRRAKLIVCGMQSNGFTIAKPNDTNSLDIVGFDTTVPDVISEFVTNM